MDIWEILYTTRAMRRLKPDPIPDDVVAQIIDAGLRAPSGGNAQAWRFLAVRDRDTIGRLAPLYQEGLKTLYGSVYKDAAPAAPDPNDRRAATVARVQSSAQWLADHFAEVPLLVFAYAPGGAQSGASVYPALWSMCLAGRALGVGSTLTTILGMYEEASNEILGVPADSGYSMVGCLPMGYPTGRWGVAERKPARKVAFEDRWGQVPAWATSDDPLWSPPAAT